MSNSAAKATAVKWFNLWVRKRAAVGNDYCRCFTCGKLVDWHYDCDAGHFQSKRYEATRFDELNVHPQCKFCNHHLKGNIGVYYEQLDKVYGTGTAKKIIQKSQMMCKRNRNDYLELSDKYRKLYKSLA